MAKSSKQLVSILDIDTLPDFLRYHRQALGLTQQELADKVDISKSTYCRYEQGKQVPNLFFTECMLNALGYTFNIVTTKKGKK